MVTMTRSALTGSALLAVALLAGSSPAAVGDTTPSADTGGWTRYVAQPFTTAAGELCRFPLRSEVVFDAEYVRTESRYADGSPRHETYVGPLVVRLTNLTSGRSVVRDLSGRAEASYARDGAYDFAIDGPAAVGFHPGDNRPPGYYVLRGSHTVHFAADGRRTMVRDRGTEENVCRTLAS